jgi:hypothetical protein
MLSLSTPVGYPRLWAPAYGRRRSLAAFRCSLSDLRNEPGVCLSKNSITHSSALRPYFWAICRHASYTSSGTCRVMVFILFSRFLHIFAWSCPVYCFTSSNRGVYSPSIPGSQNYVHPFSSPCNALSNARIRSCTAVVTGSVPSTTAFSMAGNRSCTTGCPKKRVRR